MSIDGQLVPNSDPDIFSQPGSSQDVHTVETQTPELLSLTPTIRSNIFVPQVWGRLVTTYRLLPNKDLENDTFTLGRDIDNDVVITDRIMSRPRIYSISKHHFMIERTPDYLVYITDFSKNGTFVNGIRIGREKKVILQNYDKISIGFEMLTVYKFVNLENKFDETFFTEKLRLEYQVTKLLGRGACGEVRLVYGKFCCKPYAVKKIAKASLSKPRNALNHPDKIEHEIKILKSLQHPFVIAMKDIVDTGNCVYIFLDYMHGGELSNLILRDEYLSEEDCKFLFLQMCLAVQFLHEKNITHRDLKPENVLLSALHSRTTIRVTDFGLSKFIDEDNKVMQTVCGTPLYAAPEVMDGSRSSYTNKVDVWSLGVILYFMVSRQLPFQARDFRSQLKEIHSKPISFESTAWIGISLDCKNIIRTMLTIEPNERPNIKGVLNHQWIHDDVETRQSVDNLIYSNQITMIPCGIDSNDDSDEDSEYGESTSKRSRLDSDDLSQQTRF